MVCCSNFAGHVFIHGCDFGTGIYTTDIPYVVLMRRRCVRRESGTWCSAAVWHRIFLSCVFADVTKPGGLVSYGDSLCAQDDHTGGTGQISSGASWTQKLASRICSYGVPVTLPTSLGVSALAEALFASHLISQDQVLVNDFTIIAVANVVKMFGATPSF